MQHLQSRQKVVKSISTQQLVLCRFHLNFIERIYMYFERDLKRFQSLSPFRWDYFFQNLLAAQKYTRSTFTGLWLLQEKIIHQCSPKSPIMNWDQFGVRNDFLMIIFVCCRFYSSSGSAWSSASAYASSNMATVAALTPREEVNNLANKQVCK